VPEDAHGWLEELDLKLCTVELMAAGVPEATHEQEVDHKERDAPVTLPATHHAPQAIAEHIEGLNKTLKWIGALIVVALSLLLLK